MEVNEKLTYQKFQIFFRSNLKLSNFKQFNHSNKILKFKFLLQFLTKNCFVKNHFKFSINK